MNKEYNTNLSVCTISQYVADGRVGESSKKMGLGRGIPHNVFKILLYEFDTYIWVKQINNNTANSSSDCVNKSMTVQATHTNFLMNFFEREQLISLP